MNKLYMGTVIALATISFVSAQDTPKPVPPQVAPMMTTGDATIDAQIKALNMEMETKIKAIRDDYLSRIKTIVGDKKPMMASTTPRGMMEGKKKGFDDGKKMGRPFASSTDGTMRPPMMRREDGQGEQGDRGDNRGEGQRPLPPQGQMGDSVGPRIQNFFRGFFGGQGQSNDNRGSSNGNDLGPKPNN